jgi:hypothetical protein
VETRYRPGDQGVVSGRIVNMTYMTFVQRRCGFSTGELKAFVVGSGSWVRLNPVPSQQPHFDQLR